MSNALFWEEVKKIFIWAGPSGSGIIVHFARKNLHKKKLKINLIYTVCFCIIAMFMGYQANVICDYFKIRELKSAIIGFVAFVSTTIAKYILVNIGVFFNAFVKKLSGIDLDKETKEKTDEEDN